MLMAPQRRGSPFERASSSAVLVYGFPQSPHAALEPLNTLQHAVPLFAQAASFWQ
jgi:hypothetical protein